MSAPHVGSPHALSHAPLLQFRAAATDPDLQAFFIASGRGVKPGVSLDSMNTIDLAPTMAHLLGVELQNVDGRMLREILTNP